MQWMNTVDSFYMDNACQKAKESAKEPLYGLGKSQQNKLFVKKGQQKNGLAGTGKKLRNTKCK
jgi:hypothetical protein